jgi:VIT1/CCC1 family predicted Fe2+/Mn2+ transporter
MLLQLINRNVEWFQYLINLFIVIIGRALDILSTRYVTKELKLETNKLARKLGWKGMILIQIPLIIIGSLDFYFAFFIFVWSLFLFANNIQGSWYVREIGEDKYQEELKNRVKNSKAWKIIFGELSNLLTFTLAGIFILVFIFIINDLMAVFFICLALIFQGLLGTFRSLRYLFDLKKEETEVNNE